MELAVAAAVSDSERVGWATLFEGLAAGYHRRSTCFGCDELYQYYYYRAVNTVNTALALRVAEYPWL